MPKQLNPRDYGVGSFQELARIIGTLGGEYDPRHGGGAAAKAMILDIARNRSVHPEYQKFNRATDKGMEGGPEDYTGIAAQMVHPKQFSTWGEAQKGAFKKATDLHNDIIELSRRPEAWESLPAARQQEINEGLEAMRGVLVTRDLEGAAGGALMYGNPAGMKAAMRRTHENTYGARDSADMYGHRYYTGRPGETRSVREAIERFDLEGRLARMRLGPLPEPEAGYAALDPALYDPATSADYIGSPQGGPGFGQIIPGQFPERPPEFTGGEYRISPDAPANDQFNINRTMGGFRSMRAGGADVAGIDLSGIAFDQHGNPLGNTGVSRAWQEGLRDLQGAYDNTQGAFADSADFAGRYAYGGDIRPQDALFLRDNPGSFVTREGRQVLPIESARDVLGLGSPQDYAGRYDTAEIGLDDALFLKDNPSFTLARGGANTGYGYRLDPTTGAYVPNTTGAGGDQRFEDTGGAPAPGPARTLDPRTGVYTDTPGYDSVTGMVFNPMVNYNKQAPSPNDINGFNTPATPWAPPPTPDFSASSPPSPVYNTLPNSNQPSLLFGDQYGNTFGGLPLGSSSVSPSTVGPSGVASPYPGDPNRTTEPRGISIIMPHTLDTW